MKGFCLIEHGIPKAKIKSNVLETVQRIYVLILGVKELHENSSK